MTRIASRILIPVAMLAIGAAHAQPKNLGSYVGTIDVSGTQHGPEVSYRARVTKISLPVSDRDGSSINAEFLSGEAPNARVLVSQWDSFHREKSPDSGGQFNTVTCKLAAPAEISMTATGVLNVDLRKRQHSMSIVLLSAGPGGDLAFNCTHSRSGPFKKKGGIAFALGTGTPGMQAETQLPFTDASHLAAKYTLDPTAETKGQYGPIVQQWELKLVP